MATITKTVHIDAIPETVWKVVGDIGAIADWMPMIGKTIVQGDTRICTMAEGTPAPGALLKERILARDQQQRRYEYTITDGPAPIVSHRASFQVDSDGAGSKVTWTTEVTPDELATDWAPVFETELQALKHYLER